jgi:hypothetical protein
MLQDAAGCSRRTATTTRTTRTTISGGHTGHGTRDLCLSLCEAGSLCRGCGEAALDPYGDHALVCCSLFQVHPRAVAAR